MCQAQILNYDRNFIQAALRYHDLSFHPNVDAQEQQFALEQAVIAAILAPAGAQRARICAQLYKDERIQACQGYHVLKKMYLDRILPSHLVDDFSKILKPHQKALLSDNETVLSRAVTEHNMLCASHLYKNIELEQIGHLLGVDKIKAEKVAARMIGEGRLQGQIDQVEGYIYFHNGKDHTLHFSVSEPHSD